MLRKDKEETKMKTNLVTTISKDGKTSVVDQNAERILIKAEKITIVGERYETNKRRTKRTHIPNW
ncbi:hypothetical protein CON46_22785 [Bacillus cereus]|nr:hypothetical protein CON46_22785 [Bacillus cereus]PFQ19917.1 hypothetical protein COK16_27875 [Bacillus cereus]